VALTASLRRLASGALELLHTRLELLSVELQELASAAGQALARFALAALLLQVAVGCAVAALALAMAPEHRAALLGGLALLLAVIAALLVHGALAQARRLRRPFGASLDELAQDRAALQPAEPAK
jgi:uncharacterized membrane protein YqjE